MRNSALRPCPSNDRIQGHGTAHQSEYVGHATFGLHEVESVPIDGVAGEQGPCLNEDMLCKKVQSMQALHCAESIDGLWLELVAKLPGTSNGPLFVSMVFAEASRNS